LHYIAWLGETDAHGIDRASVTIEHRGSCGGESPSVTAAAKALRRTNRAAALREYCGERVRASFAQRCAARRADVGALVRDLH
jgi:hypothetical protein